MAQGQVVFNNRITNILIAPIFDVDSIDPTIVRHGNTATGTPAGAQQYSGALLTGTGYTAQLFGGPTNSPVENLAALLPVTTFRPADAAGFVVPPAQTIIVDGVPEGQVAKFVLRVWRNSGGFTNWQQVLTNASTPRGESLPFISPPLGGIFFAPPNLVGLQSFNLALPTFAEPEIRLLPLSYQSNGTCTVNFTAVTNRAYSIRASVDLTNWTTLTTNFFVPASPAGFSDGGASLYSNRFYQISFP